MVAYPPPALEADFTDATAANGNLARQLNTIGQAVNAVVTALGGTPQGNYPSVAARFAGLAGLTPGLLFVRPEDYGAKRDGTTDDSGAIGAALAATNLTGWALLLSPGTYYFAPANTISVPVGTRIAGASTTITGPGTAFPWLTLSSRTTITGVQFVATTANTGGLLTPAAGSSGVLIDGCGLTGQGSGPAMVMSGGVSGVKIQRTMLTSWDNGIVLTGGCNVLDIVESTLAPLRLTGQGSTTQCQRVRINRSTIGSTTATCLTLVNGLDCRVEASTLTGPGSVPLIAITNPVAVRVTDNSLNGTGATTGTAAAITITGNTDSLIVDGNVSDAASVWPVFYTEAAIATAGRPPLRLSNNSLVNFRGTTVTSLAGASTACTNNTLNGVQLELDGSSMSYQAAAFILPSNGYLAAVAPQGTPNIRGGNKLTYIGNGNTRVNMDGVGSYGVTAQLRFQSAASGGASVANLIIFLQANNTTIRTHFYLDPITDAFSLNLTWLDVRLQAGDVIRIAYQGDQNVDLVGGASTYVSYQRGK